MKTYLIKLCIVLLCVSGCNLNNEEKMYKPQCLYIDNFDYNNQVPFNNEIDLSYFNNSFIGGDSRVGSLVLYNKLTNADVKYIESLSLNMLNITKLNKDDENSPTMYQLFMNTDKENIYVMLGLNEIGWSTYEKWGVSYENFIKDLKNNHPNSNIYLILLYTPSNAYLVDKDTLINRVNKMNEVLIDIAKRNFVYYLNINESLVGEDGYIKEEYTFDGIHLTSSGTDVFIEYLRTHVGGSNYVKEICE